MSKPPPSEDCSMGPRQPQTPKPAPPPPVEKVPKI